VKRSLIIAISAASGLALLAGGAVAGAAVAGPIDSAGVIHAWSENMTSAGRAAAPGGASASAGSGAVGQPAAVRGWLVSGLRAWMVTL
jgi:hypothetical protein